MEAFAALASTSWTLRPLSLFGTYPFSCEIGVKPAGVGTVLVDVVVVVVSTTEVSVSVAVTVDVWVVKSIPSQLLDNSFRMIFVYQLRSL